MKSHANQGNHQIKIQIEWTHSLLYASKVQGAKYSLPLHALLESCSLKEKHLNGFRKSFQFPKGTSIRLPCLGEKACNFAHKEVCFYEVDFLCGLHFLVHPFIMQVLNAIRKEMFRYCSVSEGNHCISFYKFMLVVLCLRKIHSQLKP